MNVLYVAHQGDLGGATSPIVEAVDALAPRGFRAQVLLPDAGSMAGALDARGVSWHVAPVVPWASTRGRRRWRNIVANLCARGGMRRAVAECAPDVVVTNSTTVGVAARAAAELGVPHVWWLHEFGKEDHNLHFDLGDRWTGRQLDLLCAAAIAPSDALARHFAGRIRPDKIFRVDYDVPAAPAANVPEFEPRSAFHLALAGSLNPQKGQADAIAATGRLVAQGRNVRLHLFGTGGRGYTAKLRALAARAGASSHVLFHGHVDHLGARLAKAQVSLMTSRCEGLGRVTIEAMRAALPVIGTASGGTPELVRDGETGLLYPPGDDLALAQAIARLIDEPGLAARLGTAARDWIAPRYDAAGFADGMERVLRTARAAA
jgi:glycosyltransferase involved in cell wall biosynthesis